MVLADLIEREFTQDDNEEEQDFSVKAEGGEEG